MQILCADMRLPKIRANMHRSHHHSGLDSSQTQTLARNLLKCSNKVNINPAFTCGFLNNPPFVSISYSRICIDSRRRKLSYEFTQIEDKANPRSSESRYFAFGVRFGHTQIHMFVLACALQLIGNKRYFCGAALAIPPAIAAQ